MADIAAVADFWFVLDHRNLFASAVLHDHGLDLAGAGLANPNLIPFLISDKQGFKFKFFPWSFIELFNKELLALTDKILLAAGLNNYEHNGEIIETLDFSVKFDIINRLFPKRRQPMAREKIYLVLFPGAWGNQLEELVRWWFRHLVEFVATRVYRDAEVVVIPIIYSGTSMRQYAARALETLRTIPHPREARLIAAAYSMGSQVLRLAAPMWEGKFERIILLSASGRRGMSLAGFIRGVLAAPFTFVLGLITGQLELTRQWEVRRLFGVSSAVAEEIMDHSRPEPLRPCLELCMPGMKLAAPSLQEPRAGRGAHVMRLVPRRDVLFRGEARNNSEGVEVVVLNGGHGILLNSGEISRALGLLRWSRAKPARPRLTG